MRTKHTARQSTGGMFHSTSGHDGGFDAHTQTIIRVATGVADFDAVVSLTKALAMETEGVNTCPFYSRKLRNAKVSAAYFISTYSIRDRAKRCQRSTGCRRMYRHVWQHQEN